MRIKKTPTLHTVEEEDLEESTFKELDESIVNSQRYKFESDNQKDQLYDE